LGKGFAGINDENRQRLSSKEFWRKISQDLHRWKAGHMRARRSKRGDNLGLQKGGFVNWGGIIKKAQEKVEWKGGGI